MTPEFSRPIRLDTIGDASRTIAIQADDQECGRLAARFGLVSLGRLVAEFAVSRTGDVVTADGRLGADVVQACVASGADMPQVVAETMTLRFVPADPGRGDEEVELDESELDTVAYEGAAIDLGEAAAQTLALALDPFPRAPEADEALRAAGVLAEEQASPFAKLLDLKDRLGR